MKRQIIKTRPVRPYRVARIVIAIITAAVLAIIGYLLFERSRPAPAHASSTLRTSVRQDLRISSRNSRTPAILS